MPRLVERQAGGPEGRIMIRLLEPGPIFRGSPTPPPGNSRTARYSAPSWQMVSRKTDPVPCSDAA
jgi:hypothetical protein